MYWADNGAEKYEIIDGQQRTISICSYLDGDFPVDDFYFENLQDDVVAEILGYPLMVYACSGTASEKLKWFEIVNIAGEKLTPQELRNAVYSGPWVTDAKRYFSKSGCPARDLGEKYMRGSPLRQAYLESAMKWVIGTKDVSPKDIAAYMGKHQNNANAKPLWQHFHKVIDWIEKSFVPRKEMMDSVNWGWLYKEYGLSEINREDIENEVLRLIDDDDVTKKSGIYAYLHTKDQSHLNIRKFPDKIKRKVYEKQGRKCKECGEYYDIDEMEADHIKPWSEGGKTVEDNCQVLHKRYNRRKGSK